MTVEMAFWMVGLVAIAFVALRVIRRERPVAIQEEAAAPRSLLRPPHYEPRMPRQFALPPVTIETLPIDFKRAPEMVPPEVVPPIDRGVLAALVASASRTVANAPRPAKLARGSVSLRVATSDGDDLDAAETLRPASDLDDDAMTRTHMSPVA